MEQFLSAMVDFPYGGGVAVVIAYLAYMYGKAQLENHKDELHRICETHKAEVERLCESFDRTVARRDQDVALLVSKIKSGVHNRPVL